MNYIEEGKKPPKCKSVISTPEELVEALRPLIGQTIPMTGKSRTDGSNFRKIVTNHLLSNYMPEAADEYEIVPPKQKGVPAFLREYIDTYIVTNNISKVVSKISRPAKGRLLYYSILGGNFG